MGNIAQKRPKLVLHPKLCKAAQDHVEDMAKRNYFSHETPDHIWSNQRVREAGYRLPKDWPDNLNYVESIDAGYDTPAKAWSAWMNSPVHKTHLLGLTDFYASQTNVGVGFYELDGSTYWWYWCIITAPPET